MPRDSGLKHKHRKVDSSQSSNDDSEVRNSRHKKRRTNKSKSSKHLKERSNTRKDSYESSETDSGNEGRLRSQIVKRSSRDGSTSPQLEKHKKNVAKKPSNKCKRSKNRRNESESPSSSSSEDPSSSSSSSSSPSSSSSSEDDDDGPVERHSEQWLMEKLGKLQQEKRRKKEERKQQNEVLKSVETPEEKRLRRLLKKEAKERKRKERMGWDKDYMHYTNTDNPFGDANLLQTFVWQKKHEKEGLVNATSEELECRNKLKQEENRLELEKVKKRRLEREQERAQREDEMQRIQRMKEAAQFQEWEKQEDNFHLQQARLRSKIRIDDGRAKPIDLLAKYISAEDEDLAVEMHEPYTYLYGLTIRDLEDLLEDIKVYIELERGKNLDYWNDITVIVDHELIKLRKIDPGSREHYGNRRDGINASVSSEVNSIFKGKSHNQLGALHDQIVKKIHSGEEGIDVGYWESLLSELKAHMARARLRDRHQDNLRRKLFQLKQEQGVDNSLFAGTSSQKSHGRGREPMAGPSSSYGRKQTFALPSPPKETAKEAEDASQSGTSKQNQEDEAIITEADLLDHSMEEYVAGGYSPKLLKFEELEPGTLLTDPLDDLQRLQFARQVLIGTGSIQSALSSEDRGFEREARKGMTDDEAIFSVETALDQKVYLWSDKYRPRKPRYFNRVHTGFEWNKYNQTHYDMDNPPPKIVQGYKFNIFYPDLIDKHVTPEYTLTPCPDNKDFAILRFHAGPPYEDIAFKIVNREWEYSYKRGFRCQFHNNIFQLWFHFKRYRYRR